jgi:hypothetical protein
MSSNSPKKSGCTSSGSTTATGSIESSSSDDHCITGRQAVSNDDNIRDNEVSAMTDSQSSADTLVAQAVQ